MEDDALLERERYQMEQIRMLEWEELQVEEEDDEEEEADGNNQRNSGEASVSDEFTYDTSLAALHSYLGDVDDTHNRLTFLDGGSVIDLPMLYLEGVVLFPEATLPLRVISPYYIAAVERSLKQVDAPFTIGVVRVYKDPINWRARVSNTGSTAEIRQYRRLEDGSLNVVARGQQRFRLRRRWVDVDGATRGDVQIIQEDSPLRTPKEAVGRLAPSRNLRTMNNLRSPFIFSKIKQLAEGDGIDSDAISEESFENDLSLNERRLHQSALYSSYDRIPEFANSDDEKLEVEAEICQERSHLDGLMMSMLKDVGQSREDAKSEASSKKSGGRITWEKPDVSRLREVPRAFWPNWVYHMYDSYWLAQKAADKWRQIIRSPSMDAFVMKPDLLSFHIASKIPVSESTRQELLDIDGISYRLQQEIQLLEGFDLIKCKTCQTLLARRSDMLVMSTEGPLGAYVNPHGYVHEVMTLFRANGLAVIGHPVKEYSWFPGYAWSIAQCGTCESQLGWLFTATKRKMKPRSFWGIRSSQVADDIC